MNAKRRRIPDRFFRLLLRLFPLTSARITAAKWSRCFARSGRRRRPGKPRTNLAGNRSGGSGDCAPSTRPRVSPGRRLCHPDPPARPWIHDCGGRDACDRNRRGDERFTVVNAFLGRCRSSAQPSWCRSRRSTAISRCRMPSPIQICRIPPRTDCGRRSGGIEPAMVWVSDGERAERVLVDAVTDNYFSMLGVRPSAAA